MLGNAFVAGVISVVFVIVAATVAHLAALVWDETRSLF